MSLSEIMFSVFETLHDEHTIAVREEPILHPVLYQRDVTEGMCEPIAGIRNCTSECPTKIICYLKEDQSEFLEERGQKDLVNEFTDLDNQ